MGKIPGVEETAVRPYRFLPGEDVAWCYGGKLHFNTQLIPLNWLHLLPGIYYLLFQFSVHSYYPGREELWYCSNATYSSTCVCDSIAHLKIANHLIYECSSRSSTCVLECSIAFEQAKHRKKIKTITEDTNPSQGTRAAKLPFWSIDITTLLLL